MSAAEEVGVGRRVRRKRRASERSGRNGLRDGDVDKEDIVSVCT